MDEFHLIVSGTCTFYYAIVTRNWNPNSYSGTKKTYGERCYSAWNFANDVTSLITNVDATDIQHPDLTKDKIFDGIFTDSLYLSKKMNNNYIKVDFSQEIMVTRVLIKCRHNASPHNEELEFRAGSEVVHRLEQGPTENGAIIDETMTNPKPGTQFTITLTRYSHMTAAEITLIGLKVYSQA